MRDPTTESTRYPMRILEIETFGHGGLIHYAYNLSCALAARGHEVTLLTAVGHELEEKSSPPNLRVVEMIASLTNEETSKVPSRLLGPARSLEAAFDALRVTGFARRLKPDVIHLHTTNTSSLAYLQLLCGLGIPVVKTAHVVTPHERIRFQKAIYGRIHSLGRLHIAHSETDRRRLEKEFGVDPDVIAVIPHGDYGFFAATSERMSPLSARQSLGLQSRNKVALFFGYVREYKGLDIALEAWPGVVDALPDARLVVAGDASRLSDARRRELEDRASSLGVLCRFEYIPFGEVDRYFQAADLLVMPYRHISQSGVLYLALALGVPVVATKVGALPEVLRDGESALLISPESPADLSRALVRLLSDQQLRERLARGGRRVAEAHSWPAIAAKTEEAFLRLIGP